MDSSVSPKDEIWFLHVCHHISSWVYIINLNPRCSWNLTPQWHWRIERGERGNVEEINKKSHEGQKIVFLRRRFLRRSRTFAPGVEENIDVFLAAEVVSCISPSTEICLYVASPNANLRWGGDLNLRRNTYLFRRIRTCRVCLRLRAEEIVHLRYHHPVNENSVS